MGKFITFEGGDGSGKSTQVKRLGEVFAEAGLEVVTTCEPQKPGKVRDMFEQHPEEWEKLSANEKAEAMFKDRREHLQNVVEPGLLEGKWVISDRFADSTHVYQGIGMGADKGYLEALHARYVGNFKPDFTIVLDIDPVVGLERVRQARGKMDAIESMDIEFHERFRQGFLDFANNAPERYKVIDATQSPDEVHAEIIAAVEKHFGIDLKKTPNLKRNGLKCG